MAEEGPTLRLHEQPVRVEDDPDGTVTLIFDFDGESTAHWRNLFFEAIERRLGMQLPSRRARARVSGEQIIARGVPRDRQEEALRLVATAVRDANSHFESP